MDIFYTYVYLDPRKSGRFEYDGGKVCFDIEPFYVGYGQNGRCLDHLNEAYKSAKNSYKLNKIRKLQKLGLEPIIIKVLENVSVEKAKEEEIKFIWVIGRYDLGMGPLTNLTWGGDGSSGYQWSDELKRAHSIKLKGENNTNYGKHEDHPSYGKKIYNNGIKEKRFIEGEQSNEWELGKLPISEETKRKLRDAAKNKRLGKDHPNHGRKIYNNTKKELFFIPGEEPDNWLLGRLPCSEERRKNMSIAQKKRDNKMKQYTDGEIEKYFISGEEPEGWYIGRSLKTRKNMSKGLKGKKAANKNKKCYTNGEICAYFEINQQPLNWYLGIPESTKEKLKERKHNQSTLGKCWYNNDKEQGFFIEGEQPEDWKRGRLPFKNHNSSNV